MSVQIRLWRSECALQHHLSFNSARSGCALGHHLSIRVRSPTPPFHSTPQVQSVSPATMVLTLTDTKKRHIKRVSLVIYLLLYHNSLRDWSYLLRQSVLCANEAPWRRLFLRGDSTSFLHMTGLTHEAFRSLLDYLFDLDFIARHRRRVRPLSLSPDGYLGLFLFYLGSTMSYRHLCMLLTATATCSQ
jgi:hypothetical protein